MKLTLRKANLDEFIPLFQKHYGEVCDACYLRSPQVWEEIARWRKEAYFVIKDEVIIGGVLLPDGIVTGMFLVPPYDNYQEMLEMILSTLEGENIFYEIPSMFEEYYDSRFELLQKEVLMHMKPKELTLTLHPDYHSRLIEKDDVESIGRLLHKAFVSSAVYKQVDPVEEFISSANGYHSFIEKEPKLHQATKLVKDKDGKIVGALLSMLDDQNPFAYNLAVDPDHQGKGIGRYLLSSFVDGLANDFNIVRLFVHVNNPAKEMYESIGFKFGIPITSYTYKKEA
jgi:ribosomal protein S18 acetylase RimI-like enzyme